MAGYSGYGTALIIGATIEADPVANLTGISGPTMSLDTIDVSAHDSPDAYREFVAGLIDGGEVSIEGNLTDAVEANAFLAVLEGRVPVQMFIKFPALATQLDNWSFQGVVIGFETDAPFDDKLGFSATIKVSGKPTLV